MYVYVYVYVNDDDDDDDDGGGGGGDGDGDGDGDDGGEQTTEEKGTSMNIVSIKRRLPIKMKRIVASSITFLILYPRIIPHDTASDFKT